MCERDIFYIPGKTKKLLILQWCVYILFTDIYISVHFFVYNIVY